MKDINEKYRNNGIGTIVLNQIIKLAKDQNKDVSLEVIGKNICGYIGVYYRPALVVLHQLL